MATNRMGRSGGMNDDASNSDMKEKGAKVSQEQLAGRLC